MSMKSPLGKAVLLLSALGACVSTAAQQNAEPDVAALQAEIAALRAELRAVRQLVQSRS